MKGESGQITVQDLDNTFTSGGCYFNEGVNGYKLNLMPQNYLTEISFEVFKEVMNNII